MQQTGPPRLTRRQRILAYAGAVLLFLIILFIPVKSRVTVKPVCTHGEVLSPYEKTVYRLWWYEPFAPATLSETTLCPQHLKEENEAFREGVRYYEAGKYELAIARLSKVTYKNPNYNEAYFLIKESKKMILPREDEQAEVSVDGYEFLLPEEVSHFVGAPVFKDSAYNARFLGRNYTPTAASPAREVDVSLYRLRSAREARNFIGKNIIPKFPESPFEEEIEGIKVYFGMRDPYYVAVFTYEGFAYEIVAVGPGTPDEIHAVLRDFARELGRVAERTL